MDRRQFIGGLLLAAMGCSKKGGEDRASGITPLPAGGPLRIGVTLHPYFS